VTRLPSSPLPVLATLSLSIAMGAWATGCSDYNLAEGKDPSAGDDTGGGTPDLQADPGAILGEGACGEATETVTLWNAGDGPLDILGLSASSGWTVSGLSVPVTLQPDDTADLSVTGSGSGSLTVESTDPDEAVLTIPLETTPDEAPSLNVIAPSHGDILDPGDLALEASVSDVEDASEDVTVQWVSDVDGEFAAGLADASGTMSDTWAAGRTEGDHAVTVTATDSCGNTATVDIGVCQQAGYSADELDISSWQFEGSAAWDSVEERLQLTPDAPNQVGSAFATSSTVGADNVQITFLFFIGNGTGADGISLTALDSARMTSFLGGTGCGLGYGGDAPCTSGPALPGWSIEVDTYYNADADPTPEDHVAFTFDGDVDAPQAWAVLPEMEDSGWHEMVVDVTAPHVRVDIDGITYIDDDLTGGSFAFDAYVGFTAGTGGETNEHIIDSLTVTEFVCSDE
jgi:hypothetical protein